MRNLRFLRRFVFTVFIILSGRIISQATVLNPTFSVVGSTYLTTSWSTVGTNYIAAFSSTSTFSTLISTGSLTLRTTTYSNLSPGTTYYFKVKISSEADTQYTANTISVKTSSSSASTFINPTFTVVGSTFITTSWSSFGSNYVTAISATNTFSSLISSGSLSAHTTTFLNLTASTTYFIRIKISTESDTAFTLNTISTKTASTSAGTFLNPIFTVVTSTGVSLFWNSVGSSYVAAISNVSNFATITSSAVLSVNTTAYGNLFSNSPYYFKVKIATESDTSYTTNSISTTTKIADTTPPTLSSIQTSSISSNGALITWTTNENADSQVEFGLTVSYGNFSYFDSQSSSTHSITLTGLSGSTLYHYRVRSRDPSGNLSVSSDFTFTTTSAPDTTPPVITNVSTSGITSNSVNFNWTTDEAADSQVEFGSSTAYGSFSSFDSQLFLNHNIYLTGLASNTPYHYRVRSRDAAGNLSLSIDYLFTTSAALDTTPPTISNVSTPTVTSNNVTITWTTDESADSQVEFGYSNAYGNYSNYDSQLILNHTIYLSGLSANTPYHYRVKSKDSSGNNAYSSDYQFTTTGVVDVTPPSLSNIYTYGLGSSGLTIHWNSDEPTDAQIEYGLTTSYGNFSSLDSQLLTYHDFVLSGLTANTFYHYRVRSKDAAGNLSVSGDFTFQTNNVADVTPPTIFNVSVFGLTSNNATISWSTDESADAQVEFGYSNAYGNYSNLDYQYLLNHTIYLYGLSSNTTYHYRLRSRDSAANLATSNDFTFTTSGSQDVTAPVLTNIYNYALTSNGVTIHWNSDEPSDAQIEYGLSTAYGNFSSLDTQLLTYHDYSLSGLTSNTLYHYRVRSKDGAGNLTLSGDFTFQTNNTADSTPPTVFNVNSFGITSNNATISWSTDESADAQVEFGYSTAYGNYSNYDYQLFLNHTIYLYGLSSNTTYHYRVRSKDAAGNQTVSTDFTFVTSGSQDLTPPTLTNIYTYSLTSNGVTIHWNSDEPTDAQIEYGMSTAYGGFSSLDTQLLTYHDYSISGLSPNTLYHFRVRSKDGSGNLTVSGDFTFQTNNTADTTPPTVFNVNTTGLTSNNATITWNTDESADAQVEFGYTTAYGNYSNFDSQLFLNHTIYLYGLSSNTTYHYRVRSRDAAGNQTVSADYTFTTSGALDVTPPVLTNIYTYSLTSNGVTIHWNSDEPSDAQIEYGLTTAYGNFSSLDTQLLTYHDYSLSGLSSNTLYHYRVRSKDGSGNVTVSGDFTFQTNNTADVNPPTVFNVNSFGITSNNATISWSTDESADAQIEFGYSTAYGNYSNLDYQLLLNHTIYLYGLSSNTMYHYRVRSRDAAGNQTVSTDYTFTTSGTLDVTPPVLTNIYTYNLTSIGLTIHWNSDEPSDAQIEYGLTTAYGNFSSLDTQLLTYHDYSLSGLSSNTLYHYRVRSKDGAGNVTVSGDFTFQTNNTADVTPPTVFNINTFGLTSNNATVGWSTDESANAQVEFGYTTAYGNFSNFDSQLLLTHTIYLYGLSSNTTYHYRVRSKDAAGNLTVSGDYTFTTSGSQDVTPPVLTNIYTYSLTSNGITIHWNSDEPSDAQIEYGLSTAYGSFSSLDTSLIISHDYVLSGLTSNTLYHYRVRSRDGSGNLTVSGDFTFQTNNTADVTPPTVFNVNSFGVTSNNATISWNTDESADAQVEFGYTAAYGNYSNYDFQLFLNHTIYLYGLSPSTTYHFRVRSKDAANNLTVSPDYTFTTSGTQDVTPPVLTNIYTYSLTSNGVTIHWNSDEPTDAQIEYGMTTGYGAFTNLDTQLLTYHDYSISALSPNTLYHYRVRSRDGAGNITISGDLTFQTNNTADVTPPTVFNINTFGLTSNNATVGWSTDESANAQVEFGYTTAYGNYSNFDSQLLLTHTIYLYGLSSNTTYHYRVRSKDAAGNLTVSTDYTFTTSGSQDVTPPVLTNIYTYSLTSNGLTIHWNSDEPSDAQIEYGLTTAYGNFSGLDTQLLTYHDYVLSGLTSNTLYHYRVRSRDGSGNVTFSGDFTFQTSGTASVTPPVLSNITTSGLTSNNVTITWITDKVADAQVEFGYTTSYGNFSNYDFQLFLNHTIYLYGLTPNTLYHYRVKSKDSSGNTATSADFTFTTSGLQDLIPPSLTNVYTYGIASNGLTIHWNTDEPADSQIEYGLSTAYGSYSPLNTILQTSRDILLSGLTSNTLYHYRVRSRDGAGNVSVSGDFTFTTSSSLDVTPPTILNSTASVMVSNNVTIAWATDEPADAQVEFGYTSAYGNYSNYDFNFLLNHSIFLTGLSPSTNYHYRIRSKDAAGNLGTSADLTFTTNGSLDNIPPVLTNIYTFGLTSNGLTIHWNSDEPTDAQIEYGLTTAYGNFSSLNTQLVITHDYVLSGLASNTLYHYRVRSKDGSGNLTTSGDFTFQTSGTAVTTAPIISNVATSGLTSNSVTISWLTDKSADAQVEFGYSTAYGNYSNYDYQYLLNHTIYLYGLTANTNYHYRIRSKDAGGNLATSADFSFTTSGSFDVTPPLLSNIYTYGLSSNGLTIHWNTDEPADSQIEYGLTTAYGSFSPLNTLLQTIRDIVLTGLSSNTLYHYRVRSKDGAGNVSYSGDFTFQTPATTSLVGPVISNVMSSGITSNNAMISWITDKSADAQVEFGYSTAYGNYSSYDPQLFLNHTIYLYGLTSNSTYHYRVRSRDSGGILTTSADYTFTTSGSFDSTPPVLSNVYTYGQTSNSLSVHWNTDEPADSQIEYGLTTAYGSFSPINSQLYLSRDVTLAGLTPNTLYHYRVRSRDGFANLAISGDFTFSTSGSLDVSSPTLMNISAAATGANMASVSWMTDEPSDTRVEYGLSTAYGYLSTLDSSLMINHYAFLSGLTSSSIYHYRVKSKDSAGNLSVSGDYTFSTGGSFDVTPPVITGVFYYDLTANNVDINWMTDEPADTQIEYGPSTAYGYFSTLNKLTQTTHDQVLSGLTANTLYHYRVRSRDAAGNLALSNDFIFTTNSSVDTSSPAAITNLTAQTGSSGAGSVKLTWTASGDDGVVGRATLSTIKYSYVPLTEINWYQGQTVFGSVAPQPSGSAESFTVTGLVPGQNYYFAIKTFDEVGNQSLISNSPSATSSAGCQAGVGDGGGSATVTPNQVPERKRTAITFVYTASGSGIARGGVIEFIPPAGWAFPQKNDPNGPGYLTATTPNPTVTMNISFVNQSARISIDDGSLTAGDQVTIVYTAEAPCGVLINHPFVINTQGNACGSLTKIASLPNVTVTAGELSSIEFDSPQKLVTVGQSASFKIQGKNSCGGSASFTTSKTVNLASDAKGVLSTSTEFSSQLTALSVPFVNGDSEKTIYYKLNSHVAADFHYVKSQFTDPIQNYLTERYLSMLPSTQGQTTFLSNISVDKGTVGSLSTVSMGSGEIAYINYSLASPLPSEIKINNSLGQTVYQTFIPAQNSVRLSWAGQNFSFQPVPSGTYQIIITAGAEVNSSLSVQLQTKGLSGVVSDSISSLPIPFAQIQVYSKTFTRFTTTDSSGTYNVADLSGDCTVKVFKPNYVNFQQDITVTGDTVLNVPLAQMAKIVLVATRSTNLNIPIYGRMFARGNSREYIANFVSEIGNTTFKDPNNQNQPTVYVDPGVPFTVSFEGLVASSVTVTLTAGQVYNLTPTVTFNQSIAGQVSIPTSKSIFTRVHIQGKLNSATATSPTYFSDVDIPPFETSVSYVFPPVFESGKTYAIDVSADGYQPLHQTVDVANVDVTQNLSLSAGKTLTVNLSFPGDTTNLGASFPVTLRLTSSNGLSRSQTISVIADTTSTTGAVTFAGLVNGDTYKLYYDPIFGRELAQPGPQTVSMSGDTNLSLAFIQQSGGIDVTMTLPSGSTMNSLQFQLVKGSYINHTPNQISGNVASFKYLESGSYSLSVYDPASNSSKFISGILVSNGQTVAIAINLNTVTLRSVRGSVFFRASPPIQSEAAIIANGKNLTIYTATGTVSMAPLKMVAMILGPNNERDDSLPTEAGKVWDQSRLLFADIVSGAYQFQIPSGARVFIRPNRDLLNADGNPDVASEEKIISVGSDLTGIDFTLYDGSKISVAINSTDSNSQSTVHVKLLDSLSGKLITTNHVTLVSGVGSCSFEHLSPGNYIVKLEGEEGANLVAKDQYVSITTFQDQKSIAFTLEQGAQILFKISDPTGRILTSQNDLTSKLKIKFISKDQHIVKVTEPNELGVWSASILRGTDYTFRLSVDETAGYNLLGLENKVRSDGTLLDLGVFKLEKGTELSGVVQDIDGNPISQIPVLAVPSIVNGQTRVAITNNNGKFIFGNLDLRERRYDIRVNPISESNRLGNYDELERKLVDLTKLSEIGALVFTLKSITGSVKGDVDSLSNTPLTYLSGQDRIPGVKIQVKNKKGRIFEYTSDSDGVFNIQLVPDSYQLRFSANGHKPKIMSNILVQGGIVDLSKVNLESGVVSVSGLVRYSDGTLPDSQVIAKIIAIDSSKTIYDAELTTIKTDSESTSLSDKKISGYNILGLTPASVVDIYSINSDKQPTLLVKNFTVSSQDSTLDLTLDKTQAQLTASFILKIPERNQIDVDFKLTEDAYESTDDLDGNGIADSAEYDKNVSLLSGKGSVAFVEKVSKKDFKYSYTLGSGDGTEVNTLTLRGQFKTEQSDEKGNKVVAKGDFSYPFGLSSQKEDSISPLTDSELKLTDGSGVLMPEGWSDSNTNINIKFQAADTLKSLGKKSSSTGASAMALAKQLGEASYPTGMYRAIRNLADSTSVNVFSSFYDIFLPVGVSHVFTNKPTLTLKYDDTADPSKINVYYYNESQNVYTIENVDRRIDTENHTISVSIGHASVFTVLQSSTSIIQGDGYAGEVSVFNFPNPFDLNPKTVTLKNSGSASQTINGTMIKVSVPGNVSGAVEIQIFDVTGEKIRTINQNISTGGAHYYFEWDGTNDAGQKVASGVYIGRLSVGGGNEKFFKMAVIK